MKYLNHPFFGKNTGKIFVLIFSLALILFVFSIRPDTTKTKQYLSNNLSSNLSNNNDTYIAQAKNPEIDKKLLTQSTSANSTNNFDLISWVSGIFNSENNTTNTTSSRPILKNGILNNNNYNNDDSNYNSTLFPEINKDASTNIGNNYKIESSSPNFEISKTNNLTDTNNSFQARIEWQPLGNSQTVLSDKLSIGSELSLRHLDKTLNIKITDWRILDPETSIVVSRNIFEKLGGNPETQKYLTIQINKI